VFIDGIPQLKSAHNIQKPAEFQVVPKVPNWDKERKEAIKHEGLQPLIPSKHLTDVIFVNVQKLYYRNSSSLTIQSRSFADRKDGGTVVVINGRVVCQDHAARCAHHLAQNPHLEHMDLGSGVITPGLLTYGGSIGLVEIEAEASTNDGVAYDPFRQEVPTLIGDQPLIRAADGLQFKGRNALYVSQLTSRIILTSHHSLPGWPTETGSPQP
jgi:hypothetical protein